MADQEGGVPAPNLPKSTTTATNPKSSRSTTAIGTFKLV